MGVTKNVFIQSLYNDFSHFRLSHECVQNKKVIMIMNDLMTELGDDLTGF